MDRYTNVFDDTSIGPISRYDEASAAVSGQPEGSVLTVEFDLEGLKFIALNGGPQFEFTPAISFTVSCPTADEVDELWAALSAGGETLMPLDAYPFSDRYGWTADAYGVSWQIVPTVVPELLQDEDAERSGRVMEALLQMGKFDIDALERAHAA